MILHPQFSFLKVENTLFRVPKEIFDGSPIFEQMFTLPQTGETDGSSNELPLKLEGLSASEFRTFIVVTIPRYDCLSEIELQSILTLTCMLLFSIVGGSPRSLITADWIVVLRISDMWQMDALRTSAIEILTTLFDGDTAALQLQMAECYSIKKWIYPAATNLIMRENIMTCGEMQLLGYETALSILCARDAHLKSQIRRRETNLVGGSHAMILAKFDLTEEDIREYRLSGTSAFWSPV
jgi:hypothetical protein